MWRKVFCVVAFLAAIYLLASAFMQAWLTAADPAAVEHHRQWAYVFLGAAVLCYTGFGVLLRPRSVLHFCLCTVAVPVAWCSLMTFCANLTWVAAVLAVISWGYLLGRGYVLVNRRKD